ncbi:hypothetical protein [Bradyrhizobium sp. USDA 4473]
MRSKIRPLNGYAHETEYPASALHLSVIEQIVGDTSKRENFRQSPSPEPETQDCLLRVAIDINELDAGSNNYQ